MSHRMRFWHGVYYGWTMLLAVSFTELTSSRSPRGDGIPRLAAGIFLRDLRVPSLPCHSGLGSTLPPQAKAESPLGFDIAGSVGIPIMDGATLGTGPLPLVQIQFLQEIPADRTLFGTGKEPINCDQRAPIPGSLVLQLAEQFAPAHIRNGLGQAMILQQVQP